MDGQNSVLSVVGPLAPSISALQLLVKSLLLREPWLHDPLVHPMPWRKSPATLPSKPLLTFAVLRHDGVVSLHPPVRRAIEIVVEALQKQGHKVIEWDPPSHQRGEEIVLNAWTYDNGADIRSAFALSGEPMAPQVAGQYGGKMADAPPKDATHVAANNVAKREWQKQYMEYWNSTAEVTGTGRPVDAVIAPVRALSFLSDISTELLASELTSWYHRLPLSQPLAQTAISITTTPPLSTPSTTRRAPSLSLP